MAPLLGSHSVLLEMEFAAMAITITVWLNWMSCQSFRTSIDQMTGSHSNSPGKYDRDYGFPKDSWSSTGDSWRKKDCESMESHPAKICQIGCYRLASLWFGLGLLMAASLLAAPERREQKGEQQRRDDFRNILSIPLSYNPGTSRFPL